MVGLDDLCMRADDRYPSGQFQIAQRLCQLGDQRGASLFGRPENSVDPSMSQVNVELGQSQVDAARVHSLSGELGHELFERLTEIARLGEETNSGYVGPGIEATVCWNAN